VRSQSNPSHTYEVDLSSYTCTCLDFPLISYCKHICAVQSLFEEDSPVVALGSKSIPISDPDTSPTPDIDPPALEDAVMLEPVYKPRAALTILAEKLERLAARLRRPRTKESDLPDLPNFNQLIDGMLLATDNGLILPSAQQVPPKTNGWRQTQTAMRVLPNVKTRPKPVDSNRDLHYGGGAKSGSKVKPSKKPRTKECVRMFLLVAL
jgi:hypothetical protein